MQKAHTQKDDIKSEWILWCWGPRSSVCFTEENVSVQGFHYRRHKHWKSAPALQLPFSSSPSKSLGKTSQPQSHLPPLSPRLIHRITSSLKPLFPWQPGVTHLGPRCRLPEQHADENPPKAPANRSASAQPEQARTPQAVHWPER